MATYINTKVLLNPGEIFGDNKEKYAWLLLGSPTREVAKRSGVTDTDENKDGYYPLNGVNGETGEWKVENGKMTFKNANICGIAPVSQAPSYSFDNTSEGSADDDTEVAVQIIYNFPGNTSASGDNLLYPIVPDGGDSESVDNVANTQGFSLGPGYLALVKLSDEKQEIANYNGFKEYFTSLWSIDGTGSIGGTFSYMNETSAEGKGGTAYPIADFVTIIVAYDVQQQSMVNQYNFTGFNVGSSSLTISGLSSNN